MLDFLMRHGGTIAVGTVLIIVLVWIIVSLIQKRGHAACGCGCTHCPSAKMCHKR